MTGRDHHFILTSDARQMQTNTSRLETLYPIRTSTLSMHPGLFEAENNVNRLFGSLVNSHHRSIARVSFLNVVGLTLPGGWN